MSDFKTTSKDHLRKVLPIERGWCFALSMFDKAHIKSRPGQTPQWNRYMLVEYISRKSHKEAV
jgi:hypothetical protein